MDEVIIIVNNIVWKSPDGSLPSQEDQIPRWVQPNKDSIKQYLEKEYKCEIEDFEYEVWDNE